MAKKLRTWSFNIGYAFITVAFFAILVPLINAYFSVMPYNPMPTATVPVATQNAIKTEQAAISMTQTAIATTRTTVSLSGKSIENTLSFSVIEHYDPSGLRGDIDDILVFKKGDLISFVYKTQGGIHHEWDWKYVDKKDNPEFARFGGVMLLDPPNNWGIIKDGGYDLQGVKTISWEARSIQGDVYVEFLIGGVNWQWNNDTKTKESVPYPDSLPHISLGAYLLTSEFQTFQYDLSKFPDSYFQKVVGGFGWVILVGQIMAFKLMTLILRQSNRKQLR